jgi:hypothetical protein
MYFSKGNKPKNDLLRSEIDQARALAQHVQANELTAFDKATIEFVNDHSQEVELEAFREQMKRICELAGINYELEKQRWWSKYHQQKDKRN